MPRGYPNSAKPKEAQPIKTYGLPVLPPQFHNQLMYEMQAFRIRWPLEKGGLPRYQHFRNGCRLLWPWLKWNPWMERQCEVFCNQPFSAVAGCAGSSKTTTSVIYAVFWWLCGIQDSAVVLTSVSKQNIRSRAWNWVQKLYSGIEGIRIGNMVDSRTTWQGTKGDDRHCVCALAVREGSTQKAVSRLQGFHPDGRMLVIVDEATDTPEAIFESFPNLIAGNWDFQVIALGNPASLFDPFGQFCEPLNGWTSIDVETDEWESTTKINGKPGFVLHFDAEKSPNVTSASDKYDFLPNLRNLEAMKKRYGAGSPQYFKFWRGFWCPEGIVQTVLTESLLSHHRAAGTVSKHIFNGNDLFKMAFCDPAFGGGDRAVIKFATCGTTENGSIGIQLTKAQVLSINSKLKDDAGNPVPMHYQLAHQIKWHCNDQGVQAKYFGLDVTGEGGGLGDILMREWSPEIIRVEFGGAASEYAVSNEDRRPCKDAYENKVAELWYTVRELVISEQLKGVSAEESKELCNRLWRLKGKKIEVEPKSKRKTTGDAGEQSNWGMKERFGRSPDLGDAVAGICHDAKIHGASVRLLGRTAKLSDDWDKFAKKMDSLYHEDPVDVPAQQEDTYALEDL